MDQELDQMLRFVATGPELYRASPFWADLGGTHVQQLESEGFENFKRTVNTRYFNWRILGILRHQFTAVAAAWARKPSAAVWSAQFPDPAPFGPVNAWVYKTFVAMYADLVRQSDSLDLLSSVREPELGHPFLVRHRGQPVTQDLCNSIHELYSILGRDPDRSHPISVCEVGAGYGRLAFAFLSALPKASYCIVDIPPALYLSQRYLTALFPEDRVFRFRPFDRFEDVQKEFENARIRFIAAPQIELLPPKTFDYFVNVSSLHEMTITQVQNYFAQMDRLCRGRVYSKQWLVSRAQENGVTFREQDYPIPAGWRQVYHRTHAVQRMFFEALYDVGS